MNLKTLKVYPSYVGRDFSCKNNRLTSLINEPHDVRGIYDGSENKLTTLIGCANAVGSDLLCNINQLITLKGFPRIINGLLNCKMNKIRSLEGLPDEIYGRLNVSHNRLVHFFKENKPQKMFEFCGEMFATSNYLNNLKGLPNDFEGLLLLDRSTKSINTGNVIHKKMRLEISMFDSYGYQFMPSLITKNHKHIDLILSTNSTMIFGITRMS